MQAAKRPTTKASKQIRLTAAQKKVGRVALKAVLRLESAVNAGLSYDDYSRRYVDTQVAVDEQVRSLPENQLKREFKFVMNFYSMARTNWESAINSSSEKMSELWAGLRQDSWEQAAKHTRLIEKALKR